jgi:hypothetical protein
MRVKQSLPILLLAGTAVLITPDTALAQRRGPSRPSVAARPYAYRPAYRPSHTLPSRLSVYSWSFPRPSYSGLLFGWSWGYPLALYPVHHSPWFHGSGYGSHTIGQATGAIRILVKPREAQVYVDGRYVGIVDDYDGLFQRLRLPPGEYEIQVYLDGYRSVRQKLSLTSGATLTVKHTLEPLGPDEPQEPRPEPAAESPKAAVGEPTVHPATPWTDEREAPPWPSSFGTLLLRVQPGDAEVLVDGEPWMAPADQDRLVIRIAEGHHEVVVRKAGYETLVTQVEVRRGETTPLNVSILRHESENRR